MDINLSRGIEILLELDNINILKLLISESMIEFM